MTLDQIIDMLKAQFPKYEYIKGSEYNLGTDTYAIVANKIPREDLKQFRAFVREQILMPLAEEDADLPLIITI